MRGAILIFLIATSACASIDPQSGPKDWPSLRLDIREVSQIEVIKRCAKYSGPLSIPLACAEVNFRTVTCVVWITKDAHPYVMAHELAHCGGADHYGETTLKDAWAQYKGAR